MSLSWTNKSVVYYEGTPDYFYQTFQYFPALRPLYPNDWENEYNGRYWSKYCLDNFWIPILAVSLYLAFCFFGSKIMKDREPFGLKMMLGLWNLFLAIFSTMGALRVVPHLVGYLYYEGFEATICQHALNYGHGANGFWALLFVLSKLPELIDTVFIVLRKKPLIFLHWYHHVTVLLFSWHTYATQAAYGSYFVVMNFVVHSVMYTYYFLRTFNLVPKWFNPIWITVLQLSQMFIGVFIVVSAFYKQTQGHTCYVTEENFLYGFVMYASYFMLFFHFMIQRYFLSPSNKKTEKKD